MEVLKRRVALISLLKPRTLNINMSKPCVDSLRVRNDEAQSLAIVIGDPCGVGGEIDQRAGLEGQDRQRKKDNVRTVRKNSRLLQNLCEP